MNALSILTVCLASAPAPPSPAAPRAFVVLIGINEYADKEIPKRAHPEGDAQAIHDALMDRRFLGVEPDRVWLLLGKKATRERILQALDTVRKDARPEDLVLFGFFGQGAGLGERGDHVCYLAVDSTVRGRRRDAVNDGDIADAFNALRSRRVCVLLDVCYTAFRTNEVIALPTYEVEFSPQVVKSYYREFFGGKERGSARPLPGRFLMSTNSDSGSPIEGKNGLIAKVVASLWNQKEEKTPITTADLSTRLKRRLDEKPIRPVLVGEEEPPISLSLLPGFKGLGIQPLTPGEADKFAKSVLDGIQGMVEEHALKPTDTQLLELGIRGLYERLREPIPDELLPRLKRLPSLGKKEREKMLYDLRMLMGRREYLVENKDIGWFLQEAVTRLDRSSDFLLDGEGLFPFRQRPFVGFGLELRKNAATGFAEVVTAYPGSTPAKAGLRNGDVILSITRMKDEDGRPLGAPEETPTTELSVEGCRRLLAKSSSPVGLAVQCPGEKQSRKIELERDHFSQETVLGRRREKEGGWDHWLDRDKKIGYVRISQFGRDTPKELSRVMSTLKENGLRSLVLDLRFNPGGLLSSTASVAGLFLAEGIVTTVHAPSQEQTKTIRIEPVKERFEGPLVVLLNEHSASASEVLASCLRDHRRCRIVGERSLGKGNVQNFLAMGRGEALLTTALFKSPNGQTWHGWQRGEGGIVPDKGLEVPMTRYERDDLHERMRNSEFLPRQGQSLVDPFAGFRDAQMEKALAVLRDSRR